MSVQRKVAREPGQQVASAAVRAPRRRAQTVNSNGNNPACRAAVAPGDLEACSGGPEFEPYTAMSDILRDKFRLMPDAEREQFKNEVEQGAHQYLTSEGIRFPAETLIVSGSRMPAGSSCPP